MTESSRTPTRRVFTALGLALGLMAITPVASADPLIHIQTDKPTVRCGDGLWYRVHIHDAGDGKVGKLSIALENTAGQLVEQSVVPDRGRLIKGVFAIPEDAAGGRWHVVARRLQAGNRKADAGAEVHRLPIDVYDVRVPAFTLSVEVIGDYQEPGGRLRATIRAEDRRGRPVEKLPVRLLGCFGEDRVGFDELVTGADGRALVDVTLPETLRCSGHLVAGAMLGRGSKARMATASHKVQLAVPVARVDVWPEGGAAVPGARQRMALLLRDLNGDPVPAEGRVVDAEGECVAVVEADHRGLALIHIPARKLDKSDKTKKDKTEKDDKDATAAKNDHRLELIIDRPVGTERRFAIPTDTGHPFALAFDDRRSEAARRANANIKPGFVITARDKGAALRVVVRRGSTVLEERTLRVSSKDTVRFTPRDQKEGVAELLVFHKVKAGQPERVVLAAPMMFERRDIVQASLRAGSRLLPRSTVLVDVFTTASGRAVETDLALSVIQSALTDAGPRHSSLRTRSLLGLYGARIQEDPGTLFDGAGSDARDAWMIAHLGRAVPSQGLAVETARGAKTALPAWGAPRVIAPVPPRPARARDESGSVERGDKLGRAMERAPFTRNAPPRKAEATGPVPISNKPIAALTPPGLGKKPGAGPQKRKAGRRWDNRDALFWSPRLRTDKHGRATIKVRLSDEAESFAIVTQGAINGRPVTASSTIQAEAPFSVSLAFPDRLRVGDTLRLPIDFAARDGSNAPIDIDIAAPGFLSTSTPIKFQYKPRTGAPRLYLSWAAKAEGEGTMVVTARRGHLRQVLRLPVTVQGAGARVFLVEHGQATDSQDVDVLVPPDAIPGTTRVEGRVSSTTTAEVEHSVESMLREPYGCFEQSSSANYPNLVLMPLLERKDADPALLEKGWKYLDKGFAKIKTFQTASGGFRLWPDRGEPTLRYTAMAVMQLALYNKHVQERGRPELERALAWLRRHKPSGKRTSALNHYVAFALAEAGVRDKPADFAKLKPHSAYERALLANALLANDETRELPAVWTLLGRIEKDLKSARGFEDKGIGVLGTTGRALAVETLALSVAALARATPDGPLVDLCSARLAEARYPYGGWGSTQATALAIRAMTYLPEPEPVERSAAVVTVKANGRALGTWDPVREAQRGRVFEGKLQAEPGQTVRFAIGIQNKTFVSYGLGVSCLVTKPVTSPKSPWTIHYEPRKEYEVGACELGLRIQRRGEVPEGQVTLRVPLPAGAVVDTEAVRNATSCDYAEFRDGAVILYYSGDPNRDRITVPFTATVEGQLRQAPACIYSYYAPELRSWTGTRALRFRPEGTEDAALGAGR